MIISIQKKPKTELYAGKVRSIGIATCSCGQVFEAVYSALARGAIKSCGCSRKTHGRSRTKERIAWQMMKQRCYNPNTDSFKYYGGRGIKVDESWLHDFEAFFSHIGPAPSPDHSVDRYPDNNGNYEPGNVRWATARDQQRNKRR